ncbi:hypothetical protein ABXI76_05465 [Streptomyces parvus]
MTGQPRIALDDLTIDALDQLYDERDRAQRSATLHADAHRTADRRADALEATVARVRQTVDAGPVGSCCAHFIRAALNVPAT